MRKFSFKFVGILEIMVLVAIGFFSLDFLPQNYKEFQTICLQSWSNDAKQYQICMQPYFRTTGLDKYLIGIGIALLIILPVFFFLRFHREN